MMKILLFTSVFVGIITIGISLPEPVPPSTNQGWGQQQQPQAQGWGQQQPQQAQGWGQQQQQAQGWGQQQQQAQGWGQQQQQQSGWGQNTQQGSGWGMDQSNQKGKGGINWDVNFALGYQGEKGQQGGGDGWSGQTQQQQGGGWSSEPETNIKKPNIGEIFQTIIGIPREIKNLFRESGLWILFLPLLVIIPLFLLAYTLGKFLGGLDDGWGWDKRSSKKGFLNQEWDNLVGFLRDPKVQQAAKGFMDEFDVKRIMNSVVSTSSSISEVKSKKSS